MIKVGDLVKLHQERHDGAIGIVVHEETTGYGWQRLVVQIGASTYCTSTLQVRLLQNENRGHSKGSVWDNKKTRS